jgi:hypothetical protein
VILKVSLVHLYDHRADGRMGTRASNVESRIGRWIFTRHVSLSPTFPVPAWIHGYRDTRMVSTRTELIFRGPYPSVWAMLALYQHPDNKKTPPKLVSSYQQLYEPTKVDQSSRWTLEWPALGIISDLKTDMNTAGHADSTCLIQCEKADISIQSQ